MNNRDFRIVFMGTPDFAVPSLKILLEHSFTIAGVVTSPDKPAGRGRQIQEPAIKKYAIQNKLPVLQPDKLKDTAFIHALKELKPDLQVVAAFRMLPEVVWSLPTFGTINLHASLLPQYRGAAPINWAIINGEEKTGVTTFFIEKEIDTGNILFQEETPIAPAQTAGELHDILMQKGADLVLKTVNAIKNNDYKQISQYSITTPGTILKPAPKIFKEDCKINWTQEMDRIYYVIRGLSPYPAAWTEIVAHGKKPVVLKIFLADKQPEKHNFMPGTLLTDHHTYLKIAVNGGFINLLSLQQAGKKRMDVESFLRGFQNISEHKIQ